MLSLGLQPPGCQSTSKSVWFFFQCLLLLSLLSISALPLCPLVQVSITLNLGCYLNFLTNLSILKPRTSSCQVNLCETALWLCCTSASKIGVVLYHPKDSAPRSNLPQAEPPMIRPQSLFNLISFKDSCLSPTNCYWNPTSYISLFMPL